MATQPTGADYADQADLRRGYESEVREVAAELRKPVQTAADKYAHSAEHKRGGGNRERR